jgi:hypothetical protein
MKTLSMEKLVTVINGNYIYTVRYEGLEIETFTDDKVEVKFPRGMYKKRVKQLEALGYSLAGSWIWEPAEDSPIWAPYRGVFERA